MKRRKELDDSQGSIEELVEHLDRRKDEAIERTFKQVSKEFATIFSKLVPAGHGRLVIQRKTDRRQDAEDSDEEARGSVENYIGVGISVSFNSKHLDEQQKIQQLSGGQKSKCSTFAESNISCVAANCKILQVCVLSVLSLRCSKLKAALWLFSTKLMPI